VIDPGPGRPEYGCQQGFRVAGRDVNDQVPESILRDRLEVIADRVDMNAIDKRNVRLQHMPGLDDELMQTAPSLLRSQLEAIQGRSGPGSLRVARSVGR